MRLLSSLPMLALLFPETFAQTLHNTSHEFTLKTALVPGQPFSKDIFANLYVSPFHTGAGMNDAVLVPNAGAIAFLNTSTATVDGTGYHNLIFNLSGMPYYTAMFSEAIMYANWGPVGINTGFGGVSGFYFNHNGLQWTHQLNEPPSNPYKGFYGWLACNWWHNGPQLFFIDYSYNVTNNPPPCNCAEVYLLPEYI